MKDEAGKRTTDTRRGTNSKARQGDNQQSWGKVSDRQRGEEAAAAVREQQTGNGRERRPGQLIARERGGWQRVRGSGEAKEEPSAIPH